MGDRQFNIALLGNPNSGKTTLFNQLTGLSQKVGNFPGVTVEKKEGYWKIDEETRLNIVDLPGIYSLYPSSFEERLVVSYLTDWESDNYPDAVIYVANITHLERHTLLLTQIQELGLPIVLVLSMNDLAAREGVDINTAMLEKKWLLPVVKTSGRSGEGKAELASALRELLHADRTLVEPLHRYNASEKRITDYIQTTFNVPYPYQALLLAHHHEWLPHVSEDMRTDLKEKVADSDFESLHFQVRETMGRYNRFLPDLQAAQKKTQQASTLTDKIDRIVTHSIWGPLIFMFLLFVIFQAIFAWAGIPMGWIEGAFGILSDAVNGILPQEAWYTKLLTDGILAGLSGVIIFVPQIAFLFFLIGLLEEVGYMARAVYIFDRLMQQFGMNGRSVVALVSGGACAIPAIMSARTISNWKERLITILVTPLISCSARIPIYVIMIGLLVPSVSYSGIVNLQGLVFAFMYLLGVLAALGSAYVFRKILKSEEQSFLMFSLPEYRKPHLRNVLYNVARKTWSFVSEAGKVIFVISIILWFLSAFGPTQAMERADAQATTRTTSEQLSAGASDQLRASLRLEASFAGHIGKAMEPVIAPLGYDWKMGIALLTSFAAREVFVGTVSTLHAMDGEENNQKIIQRLQNEVNPQTGEKVYTTATVASLLIFFAFAMQCMGTLAVVRKETGTWKWPIIQFVFMTALAYLSALAVYQLWPV